MKYVISECTYNEKQFVEAFEQIANVPLFVKWCNKKQLGEKKKDTVIFTTSEMLAFLRAIGYRAYVEFGFSRYLTRLLTKMVML